MLLYIYVYVCRYVRLSQAKLKKEEDMGVVLVFQPGRKISLTTGKTRALLLFYDWKTRQQVEVYFYECICV